MCNWKTFLAKIRLLEKLFFEMKWGVNKVIAARSTLGCVRERLNKPKLGLGVCFAGASCLVSLQLASFVRNFLSM